MKTQPNPTKAKLSSDSGFVRVQGTWIPKRSHQLVAKEEQDSSSESIVEVYDVMYTENRRCMAFGFKWKNKRLFPAVTPDGQVTVTALPVPIEKSVFDETFLFRWGEQMSSDLRSLQSVAKPEKYLCVEETGKVSITEEQSPCFKIQYLNKDADENRAHFARCLQEEYYGPVKILNNGINPYKKILSQRLRLKRRPSCCEGPVTSHKPLRCNGRKNKKMKMSVKKFS